MSGNTLGATRTRSLVRRVLVAAFLATHVPLIAVSTLVVLAPDSERSSLLLLLLAATLVGTGVLVVALRLWLQPLTTATDRLRRYVELGVVETGGPYPRSELGTLLRDIDVVVHRLSQERAEAMEAATIDPVTGVLTRRAVQAHLVEAATGRRRRTDAFCVAMVDVDDFKGVNDRLGHPVGDRVLATVADQLAQLRGTAFVGRWGGDELLVGLDADPTEAVAAVDRARARIAESTRDLGEPVTISAGVAPLLPSRGIGASIAAADGALYAAKLQGRDRVVDGTSALR